MKRRPKNENVAGFLADPATLRITKNTIENSPPVRAGSKARAMTPVEFKAELSDCAASSQFLRENKLLAEVIRGRLANREFSPSALSRRATVFPAVLDHDVYLRDGLLARALNLPSWLATGALVVLVMRADVPQRALIEEARL
jgi:hypothetical protein